MLIRLVYLFQNCTKCWKWFMVNMPIDWQNQNANHHRSCGSSCAVQKIVKSYQLAYQMKSG